MRSRPKSVEFEGEHAGRAVFRTRAGSPQRAGELEDISGVGVAGAL
jgi:hypothetical protein